MDPVRRIVLDATRWRARDDFWEALLSALEAPEWHGRNLDALWDTLTEGAKYDLGPDPASYINGVQPPFQVDVRNVDKASKEVHDLLAAVAELFEQANAEYRAGVSIVLRPSLRIIHPK
jgi:RNAse (barnase) inhibitor barstar